MLKVIGAGFGRTGTTSLKIALETLGYGRCYHFTEMLKARHTRRWLRISDGDTPDWDDLFSRYQSTADWPAAAYYLELADRYPDAKVILTVRDADAWYESIMATLYPLRRSLPAWLPGVKAIARLTDNVIWQGALGGKLEDRDHVKSRFTAHVAEVTRSIAPERLLVYDVAEGWAPLCRFLSVPVPAAGTRFPHANESRTLRRIVNVIKAAKLLIMLIPVALLIGFAASDLL